MAESYAKARFGADAVYTAARVVEDLPPEWPVRVLSGLEALSHLVNGSVTVTPDTVMLRGVSHFEDTAAKLSQLLSNKLGEGASFDLAVTFRAPLEPKDKPPEPAECEARIAEIQAANKIAFEPGSATVAGASHDTIVAIADVLKLCGPIRMEIQGHTDSQGRESMNLELSQARANSVLNELRARRVRTTNLTAVGYGEDRPIQPNDSEEGREANRRIEFWLVRPAPPAPEQESTLDSAAAADDVEQSASDSTDTAAEETGETDTEAQEAENGQN
jgi:OOP family OmpA-OmpF porin